MRSQERSTDMGLRKRTRSSVVYPPSPCTETTRREATNMVRRDLINANERVSVRRTSLCSSLHKKIDPPLPLFPTNRRSLNRATCFEILAVSFLTSPLGLSSFPAAIVTEISSSDCARGDPTLCTVCHGSKDDDYERRGQTLVRSPMGLQSTAKDVWTACLLNSALLLFINPLLLVTVSIATW